MSEAMRPEKGKPTKDVRWRSRRVAAGVLRILIFFVPLAVGFTVGRLVASRLPEPNSAYDVASWWVLVIVAATIAATVTDRLARRLLPLTILLKMTMLFPDRAPSRMRVALRSGNFTELRKRIDRAQRGEDADVGEMSELILSLSAALSKHDRKTRGHSERTRAYTDIIAEEMGLSEVDRDKLRWAALLHDVGKLEVPSDVLNKDSKLDDDEWHLVRQHPVFGMKLIAPLVPWLGQWAQTVEHHHERYDGTGYPHGLAGSDIALGARIVAVGDAYDVMTSGRSYQRPKTPAAAREEIARMAGQQFDPVVVRALMNVSLGRLRWATGPVAVLAELPFIRGLPNVGRDAVTLLTSSAVMASSMAAGLVPAPTSFLPREIAQVVEAAGDLPPPPVRSSGRPDDPVDTPTTTGAPTSTTTISTEEPDGSPPDPGTSGAPADPGTTTTTTPPPTSAALANGPITVVDSAATDEDVAVTIDVLANDLDADGDLDPSSLGISVAPQQGTASLSDGRLTYRPNADYHGQDQITYRVCDVTEICSNGTAKIQVRPVNDAPALVTTSASVREDETLTLPLEVVDVDGDPVSCAVASAPKTGAATVPADCSRLVFAPTANFFGAVPIRISLDDGTVGGESTVAVTVTNVNDAPVAADDAAETDWGTPIDIPVLGNDVDVDGDPLTIAVTSQPAAGSAAVSGSSIRYTPTFGAGGTHRFTYRICDPGNACDTASVTVSVAAITIVNDDSTEARSGRLVMIPVASNDTPGSGRWHRPSFRIVTGPENGRARALGWGRIAYTSTPGFTGVDSLVYEICDTDNSCDSGTVTITVVAGGR